MENHVDVGKPQFHKWKPEPVVRGTFSILSTCLITMGLCVWTAVHLNIPEYKKQSRQIWRKVGWLVLALLAPEMVSIYNQDDNCGNEAPQARHPWTWTHSFYAVMGGFAFDTRGVENNYLPRNRRRMILTPEGVSFLLDRYPSLFPDISDAELRDKSKASALTKTLVCLQAGWFCVQWATRWSQNMSVSLLELNTLAHSLCALIIYLLWWDKPLDIEEPTVI
ncbi:hypothetical protein K505DRAFT_236065, partial [Melanomma pulvis-pyrius CBS 109.77]